MLGGLSIRLLCPVILHPRPNGQEACLNSLIYTGRADINDHVVFVQLRSHEVTFLEPGELAACSLIHRKYLEGSAWVSLPALRRWPAG